MDYSHFNRFDPRDREALIKAAMQREHQYNNVSVVLHAIEMPIDDKVRSLANIQRALSTVESANNDRLWVNDLNHKPTPCHCDIYNFLRGLLDMQMGVPTEWDDEETETNPIAAGYIGTILHAYKQAYPEYC